MTLSNVSIYKHSGEWSLANERALSDSLKQEFSKYNSDLRELNLYLMDGNRTHFGVTNGKSSYYVFLNALPTDNEEQVVTKEVVNLFSGENYEFKKYSDHVFLSALPIDNEEQIVTTEAVNLFNGENYEFKKYSEPNHKIEPVKNAHGQVIAYKSKMHNEIYVPFKLDEFSGEELNKIVLKLLTEINKVLFEKYDLRDSWTLEENRERLMGIIKDNHTIDTKREIESLKLEIADRQRQLDDYRTSMKSTFDKIEYNNRKLLQIESQPEDNGEKFAEQLNLIAEYPGVTKLELEGKKIKISVNDVYAYARVNEVMRRYYIGNMRIEINMSNSDVRFFNTNNARKGYWTEEDPHPHVDGSNGNPCLGNVSATIAELTSTKEIYALFLTALDYLQNANTDDVAGRTITAWDEVNEQGEVVSSKVKILTCNCERCEESVGSTARVYTEYYGDGSVEDGEDWCEECIYEYAVYNGQIEEYVTEPVNEQLEDYFEGEE